MAGRATIDDDLFLALVTGQGKCGRCDNSYWDGTKASCHQNINESSCEEGQREYFESCPEENLQKKYGKKYFEHTDWEQAEVEKALVELLYDEQALLAYTKQLACSVCKNRGMRCHKKESTCIWPYQNLVDQCPDRRFLSHWLKETVIPQITSEDVQNRAVHLWEQAYQKGKS